MFKWLEKLVSWLPFNQGKPKVQAGVLLLIILLLIGLGSLARAGDGYAQFGLGSTVVRGPAGAMNLSIVYPEAGPGDAGYEVGAMFIGGSTLGEYQRQNFAWYAALTDGWGRFDVGIGPAYLQNIDTYNGSHTNFRLMLGYRVKTIPITFRLQHLSNGGTVQPNKGRDTLLIFYRFE